MKPAARTFSSSLAYRKNGLLFRIRPANDNDKRHKNSIFPGFCLPDRPGKSCAGRPKAHRQNNGAASRTTISNPKKRIFSTGYTRPVPEYFTGQNFQGGTKTAGRHPPGDNHAGTAAGVKNSPENGMRPPKHWHCRPVRTTTTLSGRHPERKDFRMKAG